MHQSTPESDMYGLGIVFWQLLNQGKKPKTPRDAQGDIDTNKLLTQMQTGKREIIPEGCPQAFKELILSCWAFEPSQRPKVEVVLKHLQELSSNTHAGPIWMKLCQQMDVLIHPKRTEGLNYIPSLVTTHPVLEDLDVYWQRIETLESKKLDREEENNNNNTEKSSWTTTGNPPLELKQIFTEFLESPQSSTLLLLGESGLGKTLSTYQLANELLSQWWQTLANPSKEDKPYFPIFIRPALIRWSYSELKDGLAKALNSLQAPLANLKEARLLVIIDGYDECQADIKPSNLAEQLGIKDLPHVKLLVTCRPNTVESLELSQRFALNGNLIVRHFLPFNMTQLLGYLNQGLNWDNSTYKRYQERFAQSHSLRAVLRNPFVASLFVQSWETIEKKDFQLLNRWQIFGSFVEHWINTQKTLLSPSIQMALTLETNSKTLLESFNNFAAEIAFNAFNTETIFFDKVLQANNNNCTLSKTAKLWLTLRDEIIKDSKIRFELRQKELNKEGARRALLSEEDYTLIMQWRLQQFEKDSPLKNKEALCEFSHRNFFEYFVALRIVQLRNKTHASIVQEALELFNYRPVQSEPEAMVFLTEGWQEEETRKLIEPLFEILEYSKKEDFNKTKASANAATILNVGRVSFSEKNLKNIRIPGADLSYGIFDHTNLQKADLSNVNLQSIYLRGTDLRNANLSNAWFGEWPYFSHHEGITSVAYNHDGRQIVTTSFLDIIIWDSIVGERKLILKGHVDHVTSTIFSPDGLKCISGSWDKTLKIWDAINGKLLHTLKGHTNKVNCIAITSNGLICVSGGGDAYGNKDNTLKIWDTESGTFLRNLEGHTDSVQSVAISPDGLKCTSGSKDKTLKIWDIESGYLLHTLEGHTSEVTSVAFSPDGLKCISGGGYRDSTIKVWDVGRGILLRTLTEKGYTEGVSSIAFSPDGLKCASGSKDKTLKIWDIESGYLLYTLEGHTSEVTSVAFSPDGLKCISGSKGDIPIKIWDVENRSLLRRPVEEHIERVKSITLSSDGLKCISGSWDNTLKIWNTQNGYLLHTLKGHTSCVTSVAISPDGLKCISGSWDKTLKIWDIKSGCLLHTLEGHNDSVECITISPDGLKCISGSEDKTLKIWDVESGRLLRTLEGHTGEVQSVAISPDGLKCVSGGGYKDNTLKIWDIKSGKILHTLEHGGYGDSIIFNPNGLKYLTQCDKTLRIWDTESGQLLQTFKGGNSIICIDFNLDELKCVSYSYDDKALKIWDVVNRKLLGSLSGYPNSVNIAAWHNNGLLVTASEDRSIKCWKLEWQPDNGLVHSTLKWSTNVTLFAQDCQLEGAILSPLYTKLLKQKGALGYALVSAEHNLTWNVLHLAVANGNMKQIQKCIEEQSTLLDSQTEDGSTALHIAVRYNNTEVMQYLLNQGADALVRNQQSQCPGQLAMDLGQKELLLYLPLEDKNNPKQTPLHLAIKNGREKVVAYLLKQQKLKKFECDINAPNHEDQTPLLLAILNMSSNLSQMAYLLMQSGLVPGDNFKIIDLLLQNGAAINQRNQKGLAAIHAAAFDNMNSKMNILAFLKDQGADLLAEDNEGNTPLHYAAFYNQIAVLNWLLQQEIPVNLVNKIGKTPLQLAARNPKNETLELLLKKGADIHSLTEIRLEGDSENKKGDTLLHWASRYGFLDILKHLLNTKIDIESKNEDGETTAHIAAYYSYRERLETLKLLKARKVDLLAKDNQGNMPLHKAAAADQVEVVDWLLEQDVPIDIPQDDGCTPLHQAAYAGQKEIVKLLLQKGANPLTLTKEGKTPAQLAREKNHKDVVKLIKKHIERVNVPSLSEKSNEKLTLLETELEALSPKSQSTDNNVPALVFSTLQKPEQSEFKEDIELQTTLKTRKKEKKRCCRVM